MPLLSIAIPNYNHGHYLKECLSSLLQEDAFDLEILLLDDASTDNSLEIMQEICSQDNRVSFFRNPTNLGVIQTINFGLKQAKGKYFFGLAADDLPLPGFLKKTLSLLIQHPELKLVCSDYAYFFTETPEAILVDPLFKTTAPFHVFSPQETLQLFRSTDFWIPGHTSIVDRNCLLQHGGFLDGLGPFCDFYLLHKIALNHPIGYIPEKLSAMRRSPQTYSAQCTSNHQKRIAFSQNVLETALQDDSYHLLKESTILREFILNVLKSHRVPPRYWSFIPPVLWKNLKKRLQF